MSTSPDYVRLASNATRALANTALDALIDAVLVVDGNCAHLPVVLANAAARRCLVPHGDSSPIVEVSLLRFLSPASAAELDRALSEAHPLQPLGFIWRCAHSDHPARTQVQELPGSSGQRLIMLTFEPLASKPDVTAALEQMPLNLVILDCALKVTYANGRAQRSNDAIPGGILGHSALSLTPTCALGSEVFDAALQGVGFHDDGVAVPAAAQPPRWFQIDIQPLRDAAARVAGILVMYQEVTERRPHHGGQDRGERRLLALTEHARDIITIADPSGQLLYVSSGVRNSLGYSTEERRSNHIFQHAHPDDYPVVWAKYQRLVAGEIEGFTQELRIRHKDGYYRWLESSYVSALDNPLIGGIVINSRDVTERKQAETRLAQREEVFRLAADAVDGIIFEWDMRGGVVHRSRGVLEVLGLAPEDLDSSAYAWQERIHPRDYEPARRIMGNALLSGRGWTSTYRIRDARGGYKSMLERALIQRDAAGDPVRVIGCCLDVSEIKRLTDILADTQRTANIGGWEYSFATRELTWTDEMFRIYDTHPKQFDVSWQAMLERCVPEATAKLRAQLAEAESRGGQLDLEMQIDTLQGRRLWVRLIGHVEFLDDKPFRSYGSLQNIQEQKLAQMALQNTTDWLKFSMNMANMYGWRWDKLRDSFELTSMQGKQMPSPEKYPSLQAMLARVHADDRPAVERSIETAFAQHVEVRQEFRVLAADGNYRAFASTARPLFDDAGAPCGLVGVLQDISLRLAAERRLRQSEEVLRTTTNHTRDILFLVDTSLRVRFVNRGVNGMTIEDIIGGPVELLLPPNARAGVLEKLRYILATGETLTYEFQGFCNGGTHYFENHAIMVREDGIGTGISISMRNITERKGLEQEILDVSGRERQSIGRDLHDGLGQELTGVALMLRGLATRIKSRCPDVVENIDEVVGLVNQSIDTARALARGLLPVRTDTGGLGFALQTLAERSRDLYGLEVDFRGDLSPDFDMHESDASHLYRIAQEALTNAARHGRASKVEVVLNATLQQFSLRIIDDGQGFANVPPSTSGMGLKIMKYRADMLGAKFEVQANEPHGTVIEVTSERPVPGRLHSETATSGDYNDGSQQRVGSVFNFSGRYRAQQQ